MVHQRRQVEVVALPITISTITIDGKRLSPSVFKQIAVESFIDEESGELRGIPIGWVNVHQKDCPEYHHLHVLWMRGQALRVATVAGPTESERYLEKKHQSFVKITFPLHWLRRSAAPHSINSRVKNEKKHQDSLKVLATKKLQWNIVGARENLLGYFSLHPQCLKWVLKELKAT